MDVSERIKNMEGYLFHNADIVASVEQSAFQIEDENIRDGALYDLAIKLIEEELYPEAERIVRKLTWWDVEIPDLFLRIAKRRMSQGEEQAAFKLLREATFLAPLSGEKWQQAEALMKIATYYRKLNQTELAVHLWLVAAGIVQKSQLPADQDGLHSASVLSEIAVHLAAADFEDEARQVAESITVLPYHKRALSNIEHIHEEERMKRYRWYYFDS